MEPTTAKKKGTDGEEAAEAFLRENGCRILARNFRSRRGEVDIIAQEAERIIFTEVKTWDGLSADALEHAVGRVKQERIVRTARYFLVKNPQWYDFSIRFDVILLSGNMQHITHIKNAFGE